MPPKKKKADTDAPSPRAIVQPKNDQLQSHGLFCDAVSHVEHAIDAAKRSAALASG